MGVTLTPEQRADRAMSERELQSAVLTLAQGLGWELRFHVRQGRAHWNLGSGFPDLHMVRGSRYVIVELKRETEDPDPKQVKWLNALREVERVHDSPEVYVWKPSDFRIGLVAEVLR